MSKPIFFYSKDCPVCRRVMKECPSIRKQCRMVSCDTSRGNALADRLGVSHIPTILVDGRRVSAKEFCRR